MAAFVTLLLTIPIGLVGIGVLGNLLHGLGVAYLAYSVSKFSETLEPSLRSLGAKASKALFFLALFSFSGIFSEYFSGQLLESLVTPGASLSTITQNVYGFFILVAILLVIESIVTILSAFWLSELINRILASYRYPGIKSLKVAGIILVIGNAVLIIGMFQLVNVLLSMPIAFDSSSQLLSALLLVGLGGIALFIGQIALIVGWYSIYSKADFFEKMMASGITAPDQTSMMPAYTPSYGQNYNYPPPTSQASFSALTTTGNPDLPMSVAQDSSSVVGKVKFCTNCGSQVEKDQRFCINCGLKLP